jgi:hypothetical protein
MTVPEGIREPISAVEQWCELIYNKLEEGGGGTTPTGSLSITQNGTYDVTSYAEADVAIPADHTVEDAFVTRTIAGAYSNDRIAKVESYAFHSCRSLTSVSVPEATYIGVNAFNTCTDLTSVNAPKVTNISTGAFSSCSSLASISLPAAKSFMSNVFQGCLSLTCLDLCSSTRTAIPTLSNANAFTSTPIASGTGYIYINDALVDTLKAASGWSSVASQIKGESDKPTS